MTRRPRPALITGAIFAPLAATAALLPGCGLLGGAKPAQRRDDDRRELRVMEATEALAASERRADDLQVQLDDARVRLDDAQARSAEPTPAEPTPAAPAAPPVPTDDGDARAEADALRAEVRELGRVLQAREDQVATLRAELDARAAE